MKRFWVVAAVLSVAVLSIVTWRVAQRAFAIARLEHERRVTLRYEGRAPDWAQDLIGYDWADLIFGSRAIFAILCEADPQAVAAVLKTPSLRSLAILQCKGITDSDLNQLANLTGLVDLCIYNHEIGDASLATIGGLTNLKHLDLAGTSVTDQGLTHLKQLLNLGVLWLPRRSVTPEAVTRLRKVLPRCNIHRTGAILETSGTPFVRKFNHE